MISNKILKQLQSHELVSFLPLGLDLTVQYNASGNLEKIFAGIQKEDVTTELQLLIIKNRTFPAKIGTTHGTTWVSGVLYTSEHFHTSGNLPTCVSANLLEKFQANTSQFNFFAYNVSSTSLEFKGAHNIRTWLSGNMFRVFEVWITPPTTTQQTITDWLVSPRYTFNPALTMAIVVYRDNGIVRLDNPLNQITVKEVKRVVGIDGIIRGQITTVEDETILLDWVHCVTHNIQAGSLIVCADSIVWAKASPGAQRVKVKPSLHCEYCGKAFTIRSVDATCPEPHCISTMITPIRLFIATLFKTTVEPEVVKEWIDSKQVTTVTDVLLLPQFKDFRVNVTFIEILRSLVPMSIVRDKSLFAQIANSCNNNIVIFNHYVAKPQSILPDFGITHPELDKFVAWMTEPYNLLSVRTVLDNLNICITGTNKKFEGSPIFRNKLIYITGEFIHGDASDIIAILRSYSADVTTQYVDTVDCVIRGGKMQNVNGNAVVKAKETGIPIFDEVSFFHTYGIHEDLRAV